MRNILTSILLLTALTVSAQNYSPCYKEKYETGVTLYNKGDYNGAKSEFVAAKECPMSNTKEADTWIGNCNKAIEETEKARQELEAFESCKSVESCDRYLDQYPNGKYVVEVKQKKQELQAEDDAYNGCVSVEKCNEYLKKYPNGRYVSSVKDTKINLLEEDNAYVNCTTAEKCDEYLKKYPKGRYVVEVKEKRKGMRTEEEKRKAENEAKGIYEVNGITFEVNGITFKMISVQGGTFQMGCTTEQGKDCDKNEKPKHTVTLSDFWMGETEVTQELWEAVMGYSSNNNGGWESKYGKGSDYPAYRVNVEDCVEFCNQLNSKLSGYLPSGYKFALPTEAQWEYAARGGNKSRHYKYSGSDTIDDVAWYNVNSSNNMLPVKGKKANELGLYDMSGNVWEWCSDRYGDYSSFAQTDPKGSSKSSWHVLRGGSWTWDARSCRVSNRYLSPADESSYSTGFRLALIHQ